MAGLLEVLGWLQHSTWKQFPRTQGNGAIFSVKVPPTQHLCFPRHRWRTATTWVAGSASFFSSSQLLYWHLKLCFYYTCITRLFLLKCWSCELGGKNLLQCRSILATRDEVTCTRWMAREWARRTLNTATQSGTFSMTLSIKGGAW